MKKNRTKSRIASTSEILFSKNGIRETSVRKISYVSECNLASVNYYFGSKDGLVAYILDDILETYFDILQNKNESMNFTNENNEANKVADLITLVIESFIELNHKNKYSCKFLYRVFELYYTSGSNDFKLKNCLYIEKLNELISEFKSYLFFLSEDEIYWRLNFAIGSILFVLSTDNEAPCIQTKMENRKANDLKKLIPLLTSTITTKNV